jgi:hypothetical protein
MGGKKLTTDGTCVFQYGPNRKCHNLQWRSLKSPRSKRAWMWKSNLRTVLLVIFYIEGIMNSVLHIIVSTAIYSYLPA